MTARRQWFHVAAFVIGGLALAILLERLGWDGIRRIVLGTGAWFAVFAVLDLGSLACDAGALHACVRANAPISYPRAFAAQASGLAINRLTPGSALGEPLKVTMLIEHVPEDTAIAGVVMFNAATVLVAITVMVVGAPITLLALDLPARVELVVWLAAVVLLAAAVAVVLAIRRGAVGAVARAAARLRLLSPARAARWRGRIDALDAQIRELRRTPRAFAFALGSRTLHALGTIAILIAADVPLTVPLVAGVVSVGILLQWLANVLPLGLGIADGGNYLLYGALGSSPSAGLDVAMINRLRTCVLAAMGLTAMLAATLVDRRR